MAKDTRKQINIRFDDPQLEHIDALRRVRSPLPTVSELIRSLIEDAFSREVGKTKRK